MPARTVKEIPRPDRKSGLTDAFLQQIAQPLIHQPMALPISAVFRLRYRHCLMRRWAHWGELAVRAQHWARGRWNGSWGGWGFDGQIR